jgi:hypothetical protein
VGALGTDGTSDLWIAGSSVNGGDGYGREAVRYVYNDNYTYVAPLPTSPAGAHDHSDFYSVADNGFCAGRLQYPGTAPTGGARQAWCYNGTNGTMFNTLVGAPSNLVEAVAKAISRQGQTCGGWSYATTGDSLMVPVVWTSPGTPTAVPLITGGDNDNAGEVLALNGDGTLAAGYTYVEAGSTGDGPWEAFVWDAVNGTRHLQTSLTSRFGLPLTDWSLREVVAMSADGTVLTGNGIHNGYSEGWVLHLAPYAPPPPVVTEDPADLTACLGSTITFTVSASGQGAFGYQWQKNGIALSDNGHYAGANTASLTISSVNDADMGAYRCVVRNIGGSVTSQEATLSWQPTTPADLDGDCDVDHTDMDGFEACVSGPGLPADAACETRDYDIDGDVDHTDWAVFQRCYSGENVPAEPHCAD